MTSTSIAAALEYIRFQGDNGFLIGLFSNSKEEKFAALGSILNAQINMDYILHGEWHDDPKFGKQFKFERYESVKPSDEDGIYRYLVRMCKWVGPAIAEELLLHYGDKTLDILRENPNGIAKDIKGLTLSKAREIQTCLIEMETSEAVLVDLMSILTIPGLRKTLPFDLIDDYGSNAAVMLRENPYILTDYHGTGFETADRLALHSLNIDPDSMFRIKAGVVHIIKDDFRDGNTWVSIDTILNRASDFGIDITRISIVMQILIDEEVVVQHDDLFTLTKIDKNETIIAEGIKNALKMEVCL